MTASERTTEGFEAVGDAVKELRSITEVGEVVDALPTSGEIAEGLTLTRFEIHTRAGIAYLKFTATGTITALSASARRIGTVPPGFSPLLSTPLGVAQVWKSGYFTQGVCRLNGRNVEFFYDNPSGGTQVNGYIAYPLANPTV